MFPNLSNIQLVLLLAIKASTESQRVEANTPIILLGPNLGSPDFTGIVVDSSFTSKDRSTELLTSATLTMIADEEPKVISPQKSIPFIRAFLQKKGKTLKQVKVTCDNEDKFLQQAAVSLKIGEVDLENTPLTEIDAEPISPTKSKDIVFEVNTQISEYSTIEYEIVEGNSVKVSLVFE